MLPGGVVVLDSPLVDLGMIVVDLIVGGWVLLGTVLPTYRKSNVIG